MTIKELKKGEFFTKKPVSEPKETQVFIRGDYCRKLKKYECVSYADNCRFIYMDGKKEVYTDFIF